MIRACLPGPGVLLGLPLAPHTGRHQPGGRRVVLDLSPPPGQNRLHPLFHSWHMRDSSLNREASVGARPGPVGRARAGGTGQREGTPLGSLRGSASWLLLSPSSGTWTTTPSLPLPGGRGRVASPNLRLIFKTEHNTPSPRPWRSRRSGAQGWKWRWAVLPGAAGRPAQTIPAREGGGRL